MDTVALVREVAVELHALHTDDDTGLAALHERLSAIEARLP